MFAQVLVFLPIRSKTSPFFDYTVPPDLESQVRPGVLVVVPFRNRVLPGMVMGLTATPAVPETRPIHSVLLPEPVLPLHMLELAHWMAEETLTPLHKCVQTMLPSNLRPKAYLRLSAQVRAVPSGLPTGAAALLELLIRRGALTNTQIARALKHTDWQRARRYLQKRDYIKTQRLLRLPRVQPKTTRMVHLVTFPEDWDEALKGLRYQDRPLYQRLLEFLKKEGHPIEADVVYAETGAQLHNLKTLERRGLVTFSHKEIIRDPLADLIFTPDVPPDLTPDQDTAWQVIKTSLASDTPTPVLLMGVTGSGKTELYLRATAQVLSEGACALILVPEISLTPQIVRRFAVRFPGQVGLWHSGMSEGARYDTWRRVRDGELSILVGARSALFAPFPRLGLIVLDEEEDASYKQKQRPYYHARDVAEELARRVGALLILGSATPSLESTWRARQGQYQLVQLSRRVLGHRRRIMDWQTHLQLPANRYRPIQGMSEAYTIGLPPVEIVDMRTELKGGNRSIFSHLLQDFVDQALQNGEQVILFLNRRGTATYVFCRDCGWVAECPRCDVPLTYHRGLGALLCHRCGYRLGSVYTCPECQSTRVRAFGLGTAGLEDRVQEHWPQARTLRWDRDVARSHHAHQAILGRFARGDADILIGTQMVARGLDLPSVTVVGIISADTGLHMPDFRAAERTFQLLAQVAGRAGRGILGGRVVLQTYHPNHYAIQRAAVHDYAGFVTRELAFRHETGYPPYIRLARLVYQHPSAQRAREEAETVAAMLQRALAEAGLPDSDLIGPAPAFFARVRGRYRWHILLRSLDPAAFLRPLSIPAGWSVDIDPVDVL